MASESDVWHQAGLKCSLAPVWHNAGRFQRRFGTSLASRRRLALVWLEMPPAALREKRQRNLAAWPEQADLPFAC